MDRARSIKTEWPLSTQLQKTVSENSLIRNDYSLSLSESLTGKH